MFLSNGLVITWRVGNTTSTLQPWRAALIAAADRVTGAVADRRARLPRVSEDWLRRHQIDAAKHSTDR
jgi:hypothetical protein